MKLRWSPESLSDLKQLGDYLEGHNPVAADITLRRIQAAILVLPEFPEAGRQGRAPGTRELFITGTPYVVPYQADGKYIDILRIYYGTRRWPEEF